MVSAPMGLVQSDLRLSGSSHQFCPPLAGGSHLLWFALSLLLVVSLSACSSAPRAAQVSKPSATATAASKPEAASSIRGRGGYYMDDGPMDTSGINLDAIADAVPAVEPLHRFANRPYNVFGTDYTPQQSIEDAFEQSGVGSWYGRKFHGQKTSSGEIYDMFSMTAAHPTLPIPSYARVSNPANGRSVIVRVNDRGPFLHSRVIDLSYAAAYRLGYVNQGSAPVRVEKLTPMLIAQLKDGKSNSVALAVPTASTAPRPSAPVVQAVAQSAPLAAEVLAAPVAQTPAQMLAQNPAQTSAQLPQPSSQFDPVAQRVAQPSSQTLDASSAASGFFLQLGAFSVEDNARALLSRMSLEFSDHLPNLQVVRREPHFRLLAGPYRSREEAQQASRRLKDLASIVAVVLAP